MVAAATKASGASELAMHKPVGLVGRMMMLSATLASSLRLEVTPSV